MGKVIDQLRRTSIQPSHVTGFFGFTFISLIPVSTDLSITLEYFVPIMRCRFDNVSTIKSQD